jgi:hypothetical protein
MTVGDERAGPLSGMVFAQVGSSRATEYAARLLALLGGLVHIVDVPSATALDEGDVGAAAVLIDATGGAAQGEVSGSACPVVAAPPDVPADGLWASSGAMALTGPREGPSPRVPGQVAVSMAGAALALRVLAACRGVDLALDGPALLGERAALLGFEQGRGDESVSGSSFMIQARDGWLAVSLKRPGDTDLLPAWVELDGPLDIDGIRTALRDRPAAEMVGRAQLIGIPAALVGPPTPDDEQLLARAQRWPPAPWLIDGMVPRVHGFRRPVRGSRPGKARSRAHPLVVDLTALWAGPLATSFLVATGCRVVKVEDPNRPDSSRLGPRPFFDLLNGGKESVSLRFGVDTALADLVRRADVVVESSRPRALEQLGIGPVAGQLWVSITGYGKTGPWRQWSALGDDAAAAGGLVARRDRSGAPMFCGDAAADPLTGLHAGVAALAGIVGGFAGTIDLAMREVVGHAIGHPTYRCGPAGAPDDRELVAARPRARVVAVAGPVLGRDTDAFVRTG